MTTLSEFILDRLYDYGVDHLFGIPGDYILPFFDTLMDSNKVTHIGSTNELNAVHQADGYARLRGFGAAAVTYGPGAFNGVNAIAAAYNENVPLVFISGAPNTTEDTSARLYHHLVRFDIDVSLKIFTPITAAAIRLTNPETAAEEFERVIALAIEKQQPVYVEVPYNLQRAEVKPIAKTPKINGDQATTSQVVNQIVDLIKNAKNPAILPGLMIERFFKQESVNRFLTDTHLTFATIYDAKQGYLESLPNCVGFYQGAMSRDNIKDKIESADVLLLLGSELNEFNTGMFHSNIQADYTIQIGIDYVRINDDIIENVRFDSVWDALNNRSDELIRPEQKYEDSFEYTYTRPYDFQADRKITVDQTYNRLTHFFREGDYVFGDAGAYVNLTRAKFPPKTFVFGNGNWASLGQGFSMSAGVAFAGLDLGGTNRIIGVIGDGSFQMTGQEFSNIVKHNKRYILVIFNNKGYMAERAIQPDVPASYNDIQNWNYHLLNEFMGSTNKKLGCAHVFTEGELLEALEQADAYDGPFVINVDLEEYDVPEFNLAMSAKMKH